MTQEAKTETLSVRLRPSEKKWLQEEADSMGVSAGQVVGFALEDYSFKRQVRFYLPCSNQGALGPLFVDPVQAIDYCLHSGDCDTVWEYTKRDSGYVSPTAWLSYYRKGKDEESDPSPSMEIEGDASKAFYRAAEESWEKFVSTMGKRKKLVKKD